MSPRVLLLVPPADLRDRRIAGLTLLGRALRVASASTGPEPRVRIAARDDRDRASATLDASDDQILPIASALAELDGPALVFFGEIVVDKRLVTALAKETVGDSEIVTASSSGGPTRIYLVGATLARELGEHSLATLDAFETWARDRAQRSIAPSFDTASYAVTVKDRASEKAAVDALFASCIKPIDGIVSRNINRKVSLRISRILANTPVLPNHVTFACLCIALAAALIALRGDLISLAIAGTLFQLNSILDGVDGELARVKWAFSKFGEKLDSIGDDVANFSYFGALVHVAFANGQATLGMIGGTGLVLWALYLVFLWVRLRGTNGGDVMVVSQAALAESQGFWQRAIELGSLLMRRDAFVFLAFVFAICGRATWILPIVLGGGGSTFLFAVRETIRGLSSGGSRA